MGAFSGVTRLWQPWHTIPSCSAALTAEKRIAVGAGVNVFWTTSDNDFGALFAEALLATRLSTYVPAVIALNVGCAVLASVSVAPVTGTAPFGPETIDQV